MCLSICDGFFTAKSLFMADTDANIPFLLNFIIGVLLNSLKWCLLKKILMIEVQNFFSCIILLILFWKMEKSSYEGIFCLVAQNMKISESDVFSASVIQRWIYYFNDVFFCHMPKFDWILKVNKIMVFYDSSFMIH